MGPKVKSHKSLERLDCLPEVLNTAHHNMLPTQKNIITESDDAFYNVGKHSSFIIILLE